MVLHNNRLCAKLLQTSVSSVWQHGPMIGPVCVDTCGTTLILDLDHRSTMDVAEMASCTRWPLLLSWDTFARYHSMSFNIDMNIILSLKSHDLLVSTNVRTSLIIWQAVEPVNICQ